MQTLIHNWYWARASAGPYTIIASNHHKLPPPTATGRRSSTCWPRTARSSPTTTPKYPSSWTASPSTARPASRWRMSCTTLTTTPSTRYVVSFERQKTILQAILTERAPLLKRIIARLVGFDGAYHRFIGKVTIEKFEGTRAFGELRRSRHLGTDVFRQGATSGHNLVHEFWATHA